MAKKAFKGSPENPFTRAEMVEKMGEEEVARIEREVAAYEGILPLSVDYGREDLNTMAKKINEIIQALNEK